VRRFSDPCGHLSICADKKPVFRGFHHKNGFTPALIPAFSPGEKVNCSPFFLKMTATGLAGQSSANKATDKVTPSPWGEGGQKQLSAVGGRTRAGSTRNVR
jgi:hypothetical protein